MPFDGVIAEIAKPEDQTRQRLAKLAEVLRNPERWPVSNGRYWRWDFRMVENDCGTAGCAMGISKRLWPGEVFDDMAVDSAAGCQARSDMFGAGAGSRAVTAEVVASRIDDYLAGRKIRYLDAGDRD